jgi:hypothetical protein
MQIKRDFAGSTDMWPTSAGGQVIEVANLTGFTVYIYGPTFGNAESRLFLFAEQCFNTESMQKIILWHICV